jgi:flavin-dependent dehydrogenase
MTPVETCDVVIVGGGPAGTAAALWCAHRGLSVILLERECFPRHRPGETLPPAVEVLFGQLGVDRAVALADFQRHAGTWVKWNDALRFDAFGADNTGPWRGYQAPREKLDQILLDAAADAGVDVWQSSRALTPVLNDGKVIGIETAQTRIAADWVVDAAGGQHWLARQLGIPRRFCSPRLIAHYGYARGHLPDHEKAPEIVADETGWTWTAKIGVDLYTWTRLSFDRDDPQRDQPPITFASLTPIAPSRGADVTWRIVERPAGPGYLCVGDAAAVLDPASSHGVLKALMSGMMAGHVIAEHRTGTATPAAAIRAYTAWIEGHFDADVAALSDLYRKLPNPPAWIPKHAELATGDYSALQ